MEVSLYKICVYIPESHVEEVKNAMFIAGAGKIGNYDCCSWQCQGQGQFRPLAGSNPFQGDTETIETLAEIKVEMVCAKAIIQAVITAMKTAHPYEVPAYQVTEVVDI